jgi:hypothetical protein
VPADAHNILQRALIRDVEKRDIAPTSACAWLVSRGWQEKPVVGGTYTRAFNAPLIAPQHLQGVVRIPTDTQDPWHAQELVAAIAHAAEVRGQSFMDALDELSAFAHQGEH